MWTETARRGVTKLIKVQNNQLEGERTRRKVVEKEEEQRRVDDVEGEDKEEVVLFSSGPRPNGPGYRSRR